MTTKFSPKFLRHGFVLILLLQSFYSFSQNANLFITVDWPQWARENKVELYSPAPDNELLLTVTHPSGYLSGTETGSGSDILSGTFPDPTALSLAVNASTTDGYYVKLYDGYGDGWNSSGNMTISVDGVTAYTFNGSFDTSDSNNEISQIAYFAVNQALVLDDASFTYSKSEYCQSEIDPTPTITGETGGTFSSTSGLSINSSTGLVDVSASTIGNYIITYITTAPNQNNSTFNFAISDGDIATFEYPYSFATQGDEDLTPTITGQSGSFSSTSGLSINSSTGKIDVSASSDGLYTVSYTTNGSCSKIYTDSVRIIESVYNDVSNSYPNNANKKYIEYIPGTMPVIISAPHGGTLTGSELSTRGCGTGEMDDNTDILIREIQKKCFDQFGVYPYIIINNLRRNKLDPNRNKSVATCSNTNVYEYFDAYHDFIDAASADITAKFGKGLYIDLHGQSHVLPRIEAGYNLTSSSYDEDLNNSSTNATELSRVTIKNLINNNLQNLTFEDLVRGSHSLGGLLQTTGGSEYDALDHSDKDKYGNVLNCSRDVGYRTVPSHIGDGNQGNCDDTNPGNNDYFLGDYYSNIRHGSGSVSYANTVVGGGGNVNGGGGTIDGIMTEVNRRVRDVGAVYTSLYGRANDGRSATIPYFSRDYAQVIEEYIDLHYNDFSKFSYDTSVYSIYGLDPTPTITGISGGTFSSTSGLSINSSTGIIDVSSSTEGVYTVTYVGLNVGEYYKKEISITINNSAVTNTFTASTGDWSSTSNWSLGRLPIANDNISIPAGKTANLNLSNISVSDISVEGTLNINSGKSITVTGDLTTSGTTNVTSNGTSSGSIIVDGNSTGSITYSRYIKDNSNWYLISSPLENQDIDVFASASSLASGSGSNRGLSNYNNTAPGWDYYQNGSSTSGDFELGNGHSIRLTSAGNIIFTGNLKTENVSKSVTVGSNGWNLVGNPYPSFINMNNPASSTNNFLDLSSNFSILDSGFKAIYFWDTVSQTYKPINNASDAKYLAPGQGYFVKVNTDGNITLNEKMQSHQTGDYFLKSSSDRFEIKLKINDGTSEKNTDIKYIAGTTTGLDEGYDAGLFNASSTSFSLYTHLVVASNNTKYALQALPDSNFNSMIVPVGLNATKNSEITFNADIKNIPTGLKVYLEDKNENVFTRIDENNTSYKITLEEDLYGGGRFYLHTTSETLKVDEVVIESSLKIYKTNNNSINVQGIDNDTATLELISVLGKEVYNTKLANKYNQEVVLPKVNSGIYFVQIKSNSEKLIKKIILE
ncbi:T9SS type A sorting domain-containing protein [Polaribacter sp. Hel1_85]|uniref:T9SS type A sorting domain-containing protein n=1 Tax=Polaribacter sp. Hel1_85 TaxID=1250005 RepID=UPI00052DB67C|nr:T9SS type A sorting domain-containing protein [Polaribacter sp. Hel1_85]KGL64168.1 hypothetical protein PHEL85_1220 [Polaribacter sp. Hel1_85]